MKEKDVYLPEHVLKAGGCVEGIEENGEVKGRWGHLTEEMGKLIHGSFAESGITNEEEAAGFVQRFRDENAF